MKNNMIALSIVVPVYNVEQYIDRGLISICNQLASDIEVILVDDGSSDSSGKICDEYADKYSNIYVIHQKNKGLSGARNSGTKVAKGKYVAYVDSDDWLDRQWIEQIMQVIRADAPDIIVFDFSISADGVKPKPVLYRRAEGIITKEQFLQDVAKDVLIQSFVWNKIAKRELWLQCPFNEQVKCLEDYEMICRMIQKAETVYHIAQPLYYYWQREISLVHNHDFNQTWNSFQLSLQREKELGLKYKSCTAVACCIQAYRVCRKYAEKAYDNSFERSKEARKYLRKHLYMALKDVDVSVTWKLKFIMACIGIL